MVYEDCGWLCVVPKGYTIINLVGAYFGPGTRWRIMPSRSIYSPFSCALLLYNDVHRGSDSVMRVAEVIPKVSVKITCDEEEKKIVWKVAIMATSIGNHRRKTEKKRGIRRSKEKRRR